MHRLLEILEKYSRWKPYNEYIERIETYKDSDFSICIENSKALIEGLAKEICKQKNQHLDGDENMNKLVKYAFSCLGYSQTDSINKIAASVISISQQIATIRNEVGKISHGRNIEELQNKKDNFDEFTKYFLIDSTDIVCCFLIESFEGFSPIFVPETPINYLEENDFNDYWDEQYGEFIMTDDYNYSASEILFNVDNEAYKTELANYRLTINETNNGK